MISAGVRLLILLGLLLALTAGRPALAFEAPAFQGDVLDEAGLLAEADRTTLAERIRVLREDSGIWAAVYVAKGLQGDSIESAAVTTFANWRLGQAGKDNGLLVLVAPSERQMRIEVGYGLEGYLTDAFCKGVIEDLYKPAFRDNRFADGLMQGFEAMAGAARGEAPAISTSPNQATDDLDWSSFPERFLIAAGANLAFPVLFFAARLYGRAKGRGDAAGDASDNVMLFTGFGFLGLVFGLFFAVFGIAFAADPEVPIFLVGMNALFVLAFSAAFLGRMRALLSDSAYRRWQARQRLMQLRKRSPEKRQIFGVWFDPAEVTTSQGGIKPEPRGSSGSSFGSSSSSSSSGGGRSGGGGASGSW